MKKYSKDDVEAQPDEDTWQMIIDPENYKFCTIEEGYFIQPKTIAILYYDLDGVSHTKIRAKGIPVNSCFGDDREAMSYKLFVDLLEKSKTDGGQ